LAGGLNLYGFAGGDPINFRDPLGLEPLTKEEREALGDFCEKIDCDRVDVRRGNDGDAENTDRLKALEWSGGRSWTKGNVIYLNDADAPKPEMLAHEMTHVFQYAVFGEDWVVRRAIAEHGIYRLLNRDPYEYDPSSHIDFFERGMEAQAQIVQDCFGGAAAACRLSPFKKRP
jgi:hypothetical protein